MYYCNECKTMFEKIKSENRDSNIRFWAIRWVLKLETEQQYTEYMGR